MAETEDNNLERLEAVVTEIEAHSLRLVREARLNRATPASLMQEVSETVMPLLKDFAVRAFAEVLSVRQYIHEHVEPALMQLGGTDSVLLPDDAEMITQRLLSYRNMLEGFIARSVGDDKVKMEAELVEVDKVLARVGEITADDDEDDPDGDPDGEEPVEGGDPAEVN
jgi:uncharacterized protein YgfB (UPF0149 family)